MSKRKFAVIGMAAVFLFSTVSPQIASAYPPGTALSVVPSSTIFKYRAPIRINVSNIASTPVTFSVNGTVAKRYTSVTGSTKSWLFWPYRSGIFTVSATSGGETKSTVVYSPQLPSLPVRASVRSTIPVNLKYVPPGTTVYVSVNGVLAASDSANSSGLVSLTIPASKLDRGANVVVVNYGGALSIAKKVVGLR